MKDQINEYAWCLLPLVRQAPCQPIHQASVYQIIAKLMGNQPEGMIWLAVYDVRALLQHFGLSSCRNLFVFSEKRKHNAPMIRLMHPVPQVYQEAMEKSTRTHEEVQRVAPLGQMHTRCHAAI